MRKRGTFLLFLSAGVIASTPSIAMTCTSSDGAQVVFGTDGRFHMSRGRFNITGTYKRLGNRIETKGDRGGSGYYIVSGKKLKAGTANMTTGGQREYTCS
jgi:hypothetical protein